MIYARRPLLFALIRYDICMIRIIRISCSKVRRLCEGRVWLGDLIDGSDATFSGVSMAMPSSQGVDRRPHRWDPSHV